MSDENLQLNLKLGDIIQIISPQNNTLNENIYYINYIDNNVIKLINTNNLDINYLNLENNNLKDETIESIILLSRSEKRGYARQNDLLPNTWINITFKETDDNIIIINGKITDLEEDMIEINTYPDNKKIYLDFAYKGIPLNLPITSIDITEEPERLKELEEEPEDEIEEKEELTFKVPKKEIQEQIKNVLVEADDIIFSDEIDIIQQVVAVSEEEKRFDIQTQTNELLDEILSTIPNSKRTKKVLNNINIIVNRFKELREKFSNYDNYGNVSSIKKKPKNYKPLFEKLKKMSVNLYWLIPIVKNKLKLYESLDDEFKENYPSVQIKTNLENINQLKDIIENYENNNIDEIDSYNYLIQNLSEKLTPFTEPNDKSDILSIQNVNSNINVFLDNIVYNLQRFYSNIIQNNTLSQNRFICTKYNLGIKKLIFKDNNKNDLQKTELVPNDVIYINSFMSLPTPIINYSKVQLPATTIYQRVNLSKTPLIYSKILNTKTNVNTKLIEDYNSNIVKDYNKIYHYHLGEDISKNYDNYLHSIIPNNKKVFEILKENLRYSTNLHSLINELQPFLIYLDDINFQDYKDFVEFINENINNLKKNIKENEKFTNLIRNLKFNESQTSELINILSNYSIETENLYEFNSSKNGEIISNLMKKDYGNFYNSIISYLNNNLINNINIKDTIENIVSKVNLSTNECMNHILTKKYIDINELKEDNDKDIYFDEKYDNLPYNILNEYSVEREKMNKNDFNNFIKNIIKEEFDVNDKIASKYLNYIINSKRNVEEGQYAVLEIFNENNQIEKYYYKRENNSWVFDEEITETANTDINSVFCNLRRGCIQLKEKCDSNENQKDIILKDTINDVYKNTKDNNDYQYNKDNINYLKNILVKLITLNKKERLNINNLIYNIGKNITKEDIILSPYIKLRDLILGQNDLSEKMKNIEKFVYKFTRNNKEDESPYWYYCNETNTKLLPTFFYKLSQEFLHSGDYIKALDIICAEIGEISDDGDKWVDKHSGYTIKMINYNTDENYDEFGYKIVSHEVMQNENIVYPSEEKELETKEALTVKSILLALSFYVGIDIDENTNELIKHILYHSSRQIPSKKRYEQQALEAEKKGKKKIPYEKKYNQLLLFFSGIYFLIHIQTMIPNVKIRKSFPGCKKSFEGYPLNNENEEGIEYIVCIMKKISSSQKPWNAIKALSEKSIKNNMKLIYDKILIKDSYIQVKLTEKNKYLQKYSQEDFIPDELDVSNWTTFLPPLVNFDLKNVKNITQSFKDETLKKIEENNKTQLQNIEILRSKYIYYTFEIINEINNIVQSKEALLQTNYGEPFLQNVCCNEERNLIALHYFSNINDNIRKINKNINDLNNFNNYINELNISPYLSFNENTKLIYPNISNNFAESSIYLAFIKYCNFNKNIPIDEELLPVCITNKSNFKKSNSLTEKIEIMKNEGLNYDIVSLKKLLNIIGENNIIQIDFNKEINNVQELLKILEYYDNIQNNIPIKLVTLLQNMIENNKNNRDVRNFLLKSIEKLSDQIKEFLKNNSYTKQSEFNKIISFIDNLQNIKKIKSNNSLNDEQQTTINLIQYLRNSIYEINKIYPNIILNEIDYSNINIPKHWKLSQRHNEDVRKFMKKNYELLKMDYSKKYLQNILKKVKNISKNIIELMENIPFHFNGDQFNNNLVKEFYVFVLLFSISQYINLEPENTNDILELKGSQEEQEENIDIIDGDNEQYEEYIASLLVSYMKILMRQKERINHNQEDIYDKVTKLKEKEKDIKTRQLKELTEEERRADSELRKGKLGRWNIGLQKGLTTYVAETYDAEINEIQREMEVDFKLNQMEGVNDMIKDIYEMEFLQEKQNEEMMNKEAYDMSSLPEDDDYGENMIGDEAFY